MTNLTHSSGAADLHGTARINAAFERLAMVGRVALMPYLTAGYPTLKSTPDLVESLVAGGADAIELGSPFSDPLADGTTIQRASQKALDNGASLRTTLAAAAEIRRRGVQVPLLLMPYFNPVLRYGVRECVRDAADVGVDGFIIPDLPPEEAGELLDACRAYGRSNIFLLAPTSTDERIASVAHLASGFIYCVSLTGVTGARSELSASLPAFVRRVRAQTRLPLAVGFGISKPEHVRSVGEVAQAAVVGSAIISTIDAAGVESAPAALQNYVRSLRS